ncbi:hypothetical protein [Nocardia concava]|uniref:hypothetical protein n=1 Tax=Nocardia concava TaxID=257281 RepID=UPI00059278ED|nr:hypothetical protein [Nocardia concava]
MIAYLAQHQTAMTLAWVLAFLVPSVALLGAALWPEYIPPENRVGAIRARIEEEKRAAAADTEELPPVKGARPSRRPAGSRSAA